jgi:hypothetical protein
MKQYIIDSVMLLMSLLMVTAFTACSKDADDNSPSADELDKKCEECNVFATVMASIAISAANFIYAPQEGKWKN